MSWKTPRTARIHRGVQTQHQRVHWFGEAQGSGDKWMGLFQLTYIQDY